MSIQILQGTLDLMILRTLATMGPQHAYGIASHRHAPEIEQGLIDGFHACALFYQELRFAPIGLKHAIARKSEAIPDQDANLAELFRKLHARGNHFRGRGFASHEFQ